MILASSELSTGVTKPIRHTEVTIIEKWEFHLPWAGEDDTPIHVEQVQHVFVIPWWDTPSEQIILDQAEQELLLLPSPKGCEISRVGVRMRPVTVHVSETRHTLEETEWFSS